MKINITILFILVFTSFAFSQTLKADYRFNGDLSSSVAGAPDLANLTGSAPNFIIDDLVDGSYHQTLRFSYNGGLALYGTNKLIFNDTYTLVALFKFDDYSGYKRAIDFKNGSSQSGAYLLNGRFEAEVTSNPPIEPNKYVQAVLVRESNGHVRAYRDGILRVDIGNDGGLYVIDYQNVLRFAQDDFVMGGQASAGNVARLRVYDAPMTTAQVQTLDRTTFSAGDLEGHISTVGGKAVRNAFITVTDTVTQVKRTFITNPFGYFHFFGVYLARPYTFEVRSKRNAVATATYTFYNPTNSLEIRAN